MTITLTLAIAAAALQIPAASTAAAPAPHERAAKRSRDVVRLKVDDGTDGAIPTTIPSITFDQPLALRDEDTGIVTIDRGTVIHRAPTVVVGGTDSARGAYAVGVARTPAEAQAGVCRPR